MKLSWIVIVFSLREALWNASVQSTSTQFWLIYRTYFFWFLLIRTSDSEASNYDKSDAWKPPWWTVGPVQCSAVKCWIQNAFWKFLNFLRVYLSCTNKSISISINFSRMRKHDFIFGFIPIWNKNTSILRQQTHHHYHVNSTTTVSDWNYREWWSKLGSKRPWLKNGS